MMRIWAVSASVLAVIALLGWHTERNKQAALKSQLTRFEAVEKAAARSPDLRPAVPAAKPLAADSAASATSSATPSEKNHPQTDSMFQQAREMMKQPGMKAIIRQQLGAAIDAGYAQFFEELGLSEEEKKDLRQLLLDRQMAQREEALNRPDGEKPDPSKMKEIMDSSDREIRAFLERPEDFDRYKFYEKTQPSRMQFNLLGGREVFKEAGDPLSSEQEEKLIVLMSDSSTEVSPAGSSGNDGAERVLEIMDRQAQNVRLQATSFLSQGQTDTLEKWQAQVRKMTETSLQMQKAFLPPEK